MAGLSGAGLSSGTGLVPENSEDSPGGASLRGSHRLAAAGTCPRMWALRYHDYWRQNQDNVWRLGGTLLHTCYEYYYASLMPEAERPRWFFEEALQSKLWRQVESMPGHIQEQLVHMALSNLELYMQVYAEDRTNLRVVSIEHEYKATLGELDPGGPWPELDNDVITCRTDLLYETESGYWIMDYKSHGRSKVNPRTGRLTRWKDDGEYALNWQVLINLIILRQRLGPRVRGFVIQRTTRQEPYDFDRKVLTIPLMAYQETARTARELVKAEYDILEGIQQGHPASPRYYACYGRYGACDYRDACLAQTPQQMLGILQRDFTRPDEAHLARMRARLRLPAAAKKDKE